MDSYERYQTVVYKWLRTISSLLGHDILRENYSNRLGNTIIVICILLMFPIIMTWSMFYQTGDLAFKAACYVPICYQVSKINVQSNPSY